GPQAAIRELSTPVIRLYPRVLLLPLIGTIDTHRADQLMETVLIKIVEEQAYVIIIDIAGVPVVDTSVADHLLKTTEAVRLLGAQTILSGISPIGSGLLPDAQKLHRLSDSPIPRVLEAA